MSAGLFLPSLMGLSGASICTKLWGREVQAEAQPDFAKDFESYVVL